MIKHIVFYKLKDTSPEALEKLYKTFMSMKDKIEVLKDIRCGADVTHAERSFDFCLECVFNDVTALQAYINHPVHIPVRTYVRSVAIESKSVDYVFDEK